jgi:molybdopterin-containing oxidoreductase family membrane subunit
MIIARTVMGLEHLITQRHLENMAKVIIVTGGIVGLAYGTEFFVAWFSGSAYERFTFINRATGPFAWAYWIMVSCNVISPQLLWFKKLRTSTAALFVLSLVINVGMWFERFVIIVTSLHRDFLPSSWSTYAPTKIEVFTLVGSFGLFFTLFLLFVRALPVISIGEVKAVLGYGRPTAVPTPVPHEEDTIPTPAEEVA